MPHHELHNTPIVLYGRVPSKKNGLRRIQRGRNIFTVPGKLHEDWHKEQMSVLLAGWPRGKKLLDIATCTLIFYPPDRMRSDLTNKAESVMDLLVDAGVIEDDNWYTIPTLILKLGGIDKREPRVVIQFLHGLGEDEKR